MALKKIEKHQLYREGTTYDEEEKERLERLNNKLPVAENGYVANKTNRKLGSSILNPTVSEDKSTIIKRKNNDTESQYNLVKNNLLPISSQDPRLLDTYKNRWGVLSNKTTKDYEKATILNQAIKEREAENINQMAKDNPVGAFMYNTLLSTAGGMGQSIAGLNNLTNTIGLAGTKGVEKIAGLVGNKDLEEKAKELYNKKEAEGSFINSVGNLQPSINEGIENNTIRTGGKLANTIGRQLMDSAIGSSMGGTGASIQGLGVAGSSAQEVLDENPNNIVGAVATGATKGYLAKKIEDIFDANLLTKGGKKTSVQNEVTKWIANTFKTKAGKNLAEYISGIIGENAEEFIEDNADNIVDLIINGKDLPSWKDWLNNTSETAKMTTLSTAIMGLVGIGGNIQEYETNQFLDKSKENIRTQLNNSKALPIANKINAINQLNNVNSIQDYNEYINNNSSILDVANQEYELQRNQSTSQNATQDQQVIPQENKIAQNGLSEQLPVSNEENTFSNKLKEQARQEIQNSKINAEEKRVMLEALDNVDTITEKDINDIRQTINNATQESQIEQNKSKSFEDIAEEAMSNTDYNEVQSPLQDRNINTIGKETKVNAYQYENPEVKPYYQEMAKMIGVDLGNISSKDNSRTMRGGGTTLSTNTAAIEQLHNGMGYSYEQIKKGLDNIIEDNGKENNALSKKIEIIIDDQLRNGYRNSYGKLVDPNQDYINLITGNNTNEVLARASEVNQNNIAPTAQDALPVINEQYSITNQEQTTRNTAEKYIDRFETKEVMERTVSQLEKIAEIRNKSNTGKLNILFDDTIQGNGLIEIDGDNRTIKLNPTTNRAVEFVLIHELSHDLKGTEGYSSLVDLVKEYNDGQVSYQDAFENIKNMYEDYYKRNGLDLSKLDVNEEAVNDILGTALGTQEFVNNLLQKERKGFFKIYDWIKRQINIYKSENKELTRWLYKVEDTFKEAIRQQNNLQNGKNYSIIDIVGENKNYGKGVLLDTELFKGIKPRNWGNVLKDYVYNNLAGKTLTAFDNDGNAREVYIAKYNDRARKDGSKNANRVIDKLANNRRSDNIRNLSIAQSDELALVSNYDGENDLNTHQWLDKNGWEFRKAYVQDINGKIYEATLNVARGENRDILYDINNIKEIDHGNGSSIKGQSKESTSSINSIASSDENVNTTKYSMQESENNSGSFSMDSKGRKLSKEQYEYFKDSKILDRNGLLLTVYHGTNSDFNTFDRNFVSKNTKNAGFYGDGFYFTPNQESSKDYGKNTKEVYLNIKNPFSFSELSKVNGEEYYSDYVQIMNLVKLNSEWGNIPVKFADKNTWQDIYNDVNNMLKENKTDEEIDNAMYDKYGEITEKINDRVYNYSKRNNYKTLSEVLENKGYDGIINAEIPENSSEIVAFNSNQIKSIDNSNPTSNPDIRYSVSDLEQYEEKKNNAYKKLANEFGGGQNYWEANLDGLDKESAIRFLKNNEEVQNKFIENNEFEKINKPVEYSRFKTEEMQNFIKNNNIKSFKDLVNSEKLSKEYFNLWFGKEDTLNDYMKQSYDSWKDLFQSQKELYDRGGDTLRPLKSFERDIKKINSGVTEEIDNYETSNKLKNMPEFTQYVESFLNDLYSEKPQLTAEELIELAQDTFGTTEDFGVGAYMTTDGKLLDFRDGKSEFRNDHRDISSIGYDMQEFIDAGNIRMKPEGNGFELSQEPTNEQYNTLKKYIDSLNGEVYVEIDVGKNKYDGANYKKGTSTNKIISDLQYYFRNGKFPAKSSLADFRYSQTKEGNWNNYLDKLDSDLSKDNKRTRTYFNTAPTANETQVADTSRKGKEAIETEQESKQQTKKEQEQIAKILDEPITKQNEKSRAWAIAKANLIDKGIVFEELSHKTKNRELQGKWDYTLTAGARGQNAIGQARYEMDANNKTQKQISKSLEDIRSEVGKNTSAFQNYMYHQLNIDRMTLEDRFAGDTGTNYERKDAIKNKPVFGEDIDADYSRRKVAEYEKAHPEFKEYARDVYDFLDANKKELVDRGVISQELSDKLSEMYPHYVPIKRVDAKGQAINVPLDTYRTGINSPLKKATGGSSDIQPLFQTIADRTMQTYRASARNNFGLELMNTLNSVTESNQADIDTIIEEIGDENTELLKEGKNGQNPTFTVFNNGEKTTFEITKDMYDALKPQSEFIKNMNNSKLSKGLNAVSNFRRGVLTEYNPVFSLTNAMKDAQDVVINSQHPAKTFAKFPESYAQILQKGYWYNEYLQNGGEQNSYFKDGEFTSDKKQSKLKTAATLPLEAISKVNNVIEMAPRLAEYIASREAGRSVETSMLDAARVTTNFKAGGDITKTLNRNGVTFLNASVQGFQQQIRNIQEANVKGLKGYAALATKYAIAGLPALLLNGLIWKDDKDYEELQDYAKDNYYIIAKYGDGKFIRIPKGRVAATVQKIVSNATEYLTDDKKSLNIDNLAKDFWEDLKFAQDNIAPNNPLDNNVISPIIQAITNKTWYGSDLVPSRLQNKPKNEQYDESTDSLSIWLGDKLNVSPYKINYLLDQYGGGVSDLVLPRMTKQAENSMLEDKFTTDSVMKNKYPGDFYSELDELKIKANSIDAKDEDILKYKYNSSVSGKLGELYTKKREIQNSDLTDAQKKEKLKVVQKEINNLAKEALESTDKLKISGDTAAIKDTQYYKTTSDGEAKWNKVTDKEKEKNENISLKTYSDYKNKVAGKTKDAEKIDVLLNSSYSKKEKQAIYENYIGTNDKNMELVKDFNIDIDEYLKYKTTDFSADKIDDGTLKGKSVSGSAKNKRYDYIMNMNLTGVQKMVLYGLEYTPTKSNKQTIVNYIVNMEGKKKQEKLDLLGRFSWVTIYKDGTFDY